MANTSPSFLGYGTIRPCRFVKIDPSHDYGVLEADANEFTVGISMEATEEAPIPSASTNAATGLSSAPVALGVHGDGEVVLLQLGSGGATRGDLLKSDADGKGVSIATTGTTQQNYGAQALQSGSEDDKIRVQILRGKTYPALS